MYLPPDDDHPPRLDLPVVRHLTFEEAHALELGVYFGILLAWGVILGEHTAAFALAAMAARSVMSWRNGNRGLGFHDAREEPWYFAFGTLLSAAVVLNTFVFIV